MMRRFFAPATQFNGDRIVLDGDESRHLRNVLRLVAGDIVQVFDGEGREYTCEIIEPGRTAAELRILSEIEPAAPESDLDLRLFVTAYKSDKLDLVIQKAVELGVARVSPMVSTRSEVRLRETQKRTDRWRKIAMEATKQCERARVMTVDEPRLFEDCITSLIGDDSLRLMFSEKDGGGISEKTVDKKIKALIGPKGGWEDSEIELARRHGFLAVKLGRRIMRAETAAITFAAVLQHRFGDLN